MTSVWCTINVTWDKSNDSCIVVKMGAHFIDQGDYIWIEGGNGLLKCTIRSKQSTIDQKVQQIKQNTIDQEQQIKKKRD